MSTWMELWRRNRRWLGPVLKILITVAGFHALLTHEVSTWVTAEGDTYYAEVDGPVARLEVAGEPIAELDSSEELRNGAVGYRLDSKNRRIYVRFPGGRRPSRDVVVQPEGRRVGRVQVRRAILDHVVKVDRRRFVLWSLAAMGVKFVGVIASAFGWYLLLRGQRLLYPFWQQVMTAFLIGRFIGTFAPGTVGLDGYTLFEAGRYSNEWHRVVTAKALEKFVGLAGLFTGVLVTLPAGYLVLAQVVGDRAGVVAALVGSVCAGVTAAVVVGLVWPRGLRAVMAGFGRVVPGVLRHHLERFTIAVTAYEGRAVLLMAALMAKFAAHLATAVVYFFTALAIGVTGVEFLPIVFGSLIQIFGTLFSPTIAGEGAREGLQALLLSHHLGGAAQAVLSASLGFVAAEAATMWGGAFLWTRTPSWRPRFMQVDGDQVDYGWLADEDGALDLGGAVARARVAAREEPPAGVEG